MKKLVLLLIIIFLSTVFTIPAQAIKKVGQTGLQFLKVDVGARAAAMGGAFMMVGDDATAMFYNPAGIAKVPASIDVFAGTTDWIAGITYNMAGLVKNLGIFGAIGANILFCDYGDDIIGTQVDPGIEGYIETGKLDVGAYAIGVTYARTLTNKFTIGGQIKYVGQNLGKNLLSTGETIENEVSGFAYDIGTIFYPGFKSFRLGMSIRNFSPQFKYQETAFQLPLTFTIGVAMDVLDFMGEHDDYSLLLAIDASHPRDYTERLHVGGEFWLKDMLAVRAGYKLNYDEEGLTAGVGIKTPPFAGMDWSAKFDYSYSALGVFDSVNRFSLGISF